MKTTQNNVLPPASPPANCPSCGAEFQGKFCYNCGEKRVSAKDFRVRKYMRLVFDHFAHFDSKLFRTIWLLLSRPGFLTAEFVAGRRTHYMKPLQLFLVINLIFFLFFGKNDVFAPRVVWLYNSEVTDWSGHTLKSLTDAYAVRENIPIETAISEIDVQIGNYTKGLLYLYIPLTGLIFYALFFRCNPYYLCHLIFATHWFTHLLIFLGAAGMMLVGLLNLHGVKLLTAAVALLLPYLYLAVRNFYGQNWWISLLKAMAFYFTFGFVYAFYREFILFLTFQVI